jgi:hypothetical protein
MRAARAWWAATWRAEVPAKPVRTWLESMSVQRAWSSARKDDDGAGAARLEERRAVPSVPTMHSTAKLHEGVGDARGVPEVKASCAAAEWQGARAM